MGRTSRRKCRSPRPRAERVGWAARSRRRRPRPRAPHPRRRWLSPPPPLLVLLFLCRPPPRLLIWQRRQLARHHHRPPPCGQQAGHHPRPPTTATSSLSLVMWALEYDPDIFCMYEEAGAATDKRGRLIRILNDVNGNLDAKKACAGAMKLRKTIYFLPFFNTNPN